MVDWYRRKCHRLEFLAVFSRLAFRHQLRLLHRNNPPTPACILRLSSLRRPCWEHSADWSSRCVWSQWSCPKFWDKRL